MLQPSEYDTLVAAKSNFTKTLILTRSEGHLYGDWDVVALSWIIWVLIMGWVLHCILAVFLVSTNLSRLCLQTQLWGLFWFKFSLNLIQRFKTEIFETSNERISCFLEMGTLGWAEADQATERGSCDSPTVPQRTKNLRKTWEDAIHPPTIPNPEETKVPNSPQKTKKHCPCINWICLEIYIFYTYHTIYNHIFTCLLTYNYL